MPIQRLHATSVKYAGQGVLITGDAGRGKSSLAIALIAQGAHLVADDQIALHAIPDGRLIATRPANLPPLIEARGIGLLNAPITRSAAISFVIDMNVDEDQRLPPPRQITIMGVERPLLYRGPSIHFAHSVAHFMRHGRGMS